MMFPANTLLLLDSDRLFVPLELASRQVTAYHATALNTLHAPRAMQIISGV
jgi:hypothetical protein